MSGQSDKWCWERVRDAMERNRGNTYKCLSEVLQILLETCVGLFVFIFENLIGLIALILGIVYIDDCSVRPRIPISLIVFGVFSVVHGLTIQLIRWKCVNFNESGDGFATLLKLVLTVSSIGAFISFIWMSIEVYSAYSDVNTKNSWSANCNWWLYWFAFVFITIVMVILLLILFLCCCMCCFVATGTAAMSDMPSPTVIILKTDAK